MSSTRHSASKRVAPYALAVLVSAALSACYVVPVDPRTGQAYPIARPDLQNASPGGGSPSSRRPRRRRRCRARSPCACTR